jgi:hypothetical protein
MSQTAQATRPTGARRSPASSALPPHVPPYALAFGAGAAVFLLYALTLAPSTAFWDASEYIAVAHILGIPHPPGNPLFVLMAAAWEHGLGFTGLSVAVRVNLFSALMTASASVCWFLVVHRILAYFTPSEGVRRAGAAAAVLVSATAFTVWNHSNVNEKVYTISLFTIALLSWLAFLWRDHIEAHSGVPQAQAPGRGWHDDNVLVLMVFVLALSVGNHLMAFLAAPALLLFVVLVKPQVLMNWRLYAWGAVFGLIGLTVHLYLPIRSGLDPIINEAAPTCASIGEALVSIVTFGNAGCENLSAALQREQYAKPPVTERLAPFWAQMANYFQYFDWQWSRGIQGTQTYFAPGRLPITLLFISLGGYGAYRHYLRDRISFAYIATLFATLSVGLVFYLNFKYGFNQAAAMGLSWELAEVRERDYFFIVSFSVWGIWVGVGLTALWLRAQEAFAGKPRAALFTSPIMALAFLPLVLNWSYASRAGDFAARDWAFNLLNSVEPYGVLFTNGDNDTFPLWYLQEVEGMRRDVTVIVWSYLNTPWYVRQLRDLTRPCERPGQWRDDPTRIICQRDFEPQTAASLWAGVTPTAPTRTILPLSDAQAEAATMGAIQLPQDAEFTARGLETVIPAGTVLAPADQLILLMIREAWGDRPIYFAATTNAHRKLGLNPFVARQGVAYRLLDPADPQSMAGLMAMPQDHPYAAIFGAYLDVERTQQLLWSDFVYRDLIHRPRWVDDATRGIPTYYAYAHLALAQARRMAGDDAASDRDMQRVEDWMGLAER